MKKAVISTGGKQYLVREGETLEVNLLSESGKTVTFNPLLIIDGDKVNIGTPELKNASVAAEVSIASVKSDKVTAIRYKAKKRVKKVRGHRQTLTQIKIKTIA